MLPLEIFCVRTKLDRFAVFKDILYIILNPARTFQSTLHTSGEGDFIPSLPVLKMF